MVYVLNIKGLPLMPCTEAKARKLLKLNKAKIVKRNPFTIQLLFECEDKTQPINLGIGGIDSNDNAFVDCPICKAGNETSIKTIKQIYCWRCGQAIKWE